MPDSKTHIISRLQSDILRWQGFAAPAAGQAKGLGLGAIEKAFPNGIFPIGTIHEMLCTTPEQAAATSGFLSGLLSLLMQHDGVCIWVSDFRKIFPAGLNVFNLPPHKVIFVDVSRQKEVLWVAEEALKCEGITAVIAEVNEISFPQSRRLQLAVENSKVTGFILRRDARKLSTTTCVARWQITHQPSELLDGMPGVGHPRWQVELLRVRNGNPGVWQVEWSEGKFKHVQKPSRIAINPQRRFAMLQKAFEVNINHERKAG